MIIEIGVVMVTVGEKQTPHLLLTSSKTLRIGLLPLTKDELQASAAQLRQRELGPLAYAHRDHVAQVGWVISTEGFEHREPAEADQHMLADIETWRTAVIQQTESIAIKKWSTWRHAFRKETNRIRRDLAKKGLIVDVQGNVEVVTMTEQERQEEAAEGLATSP